MEGDHELIFQNLTLKYKKKELLKNLNGRITTNSMIAILGPSGAGKSSLLDSLAGRVSGNLSLYGSISINGYERKEVDWPSLVGYVEQEFYAYEQQTVKETFDFTSESKEIEKFKVDKLINLLNLNNCRNTYIYQLSGGEKKRVSIGIELLNDPMFLFLDEPLSGLDSFNAMNIIEILSNLKTNKCIIMTVHQPSYKMLQFFDKIILISEGMIVFDGDVNDGINFFEENGFICPKFNSPADFFLETISINTLNDDTKMNSYQNLYKLIQARKILPFKITKKEFIFRTAPTNYGKNLVPLIKRNASNFFRDKRFIATQFIQKIVFIILLGSIYFNISDSLDSIRSISGLIIFLIINSMFGTCAPIYNTFGSERKIIKRERRSGLYSGFQAYIAKFVVEYSFIFVITIFYVSFIYWIVRLDKNIFTFLYFLLIQTMIANFACSFALAISTITPNQRSAQVVGSLISILFVINSSFFSSANTIPKLIKWIIWISPVNYAFRASMQVIFKNKIFVGEIQKLGKNVLTEMSVERPHSFLCILIIFFYSLIFMAIGCVTLQYKGNLSLNLDRKPEEEEKV